MNRIRLYNELTESQRKLVNKALEGQIDGNIDLYKALFALGLLKHEKNFVKLNTLSAEERKDLEIVKSYLNALEADREERNLNFCNDYGDEWEVIQEKVHDMIQADDMNVEDIKDYAVKQEEKIVEILANKYDFSIKDARQFTGNLKFNFKTDEEIRRDKKHETVEEVYKDYFMNQAKLQYNDYSSIYMLVKVLESSWNGCNANLEYDLDIKDDYLYLENTKICSMNQLISCYVEADSVMYQLRDDKILVIVIHWVQGKDAYISQIYIENDEDEDEENSITLYEK